MLIRQLAIIGGLVALAACGGSPEGPSPTPQSLRITPSVDLIRIKASETLIAVTTSTGGAESNATATWTSDTPAVAQIDANGRVTGQASGSSMITARANGLSATTTLRVVPDYHGRWEGTTRVTACADEGDFRTLCDDVAGGGVPLVTSVTQTRDALSADVDFDGAKGRISTSVQPNGRFVTTRQLTLTIEDITFEVGLLEWDTTTTDNQLMTGRYRLEIRHSLLTGFWRLDGDFAAVQKTSGTPGLVAVDGISHKSTRARLFGRLSSAASRRK